MFPATAPVKPRIVSPETGETILLEQALLDWIERKQPRVLQIVGGRGAGKTVALQHLESVCPPTERLQYIDNVGAVKAASLLAKGTLIVCSATSPDYPPWMAAEIAQCPLAPWGNDEFIEYLLAVHPRQCRSVMTRLQAAPDRNLTAGNAELSRIVLDRMAADETISRVSDALFAEVESHIDSEALRRRVAAFALEIWTEGANATDALDRLQYWCELPLFRLLSHRPVQRSLMGLAAKEMVEQIRSHPCPEILQWSIFHEPALLLEVARQLDDPAREKLVAITERDKRHEFHAVAASILIAADPSWRPPRRRFPRLRGARLVGAQWREIDLSKRDLYNVVLRRADLRDANLNRTSLINAILQEATFDGASLDYAVAEGADFRSASLARVSATHTKFERGRFRGANLSDGNFESASFFHAILRGAKFCRAKLSRANFNLARIDEADFAEANLEGAILEHVELFRANFTGAKFPSARLVGSNLEFMSLPGANFASANLAQAWLTGSVIPGGNFRKASLRRAGLAEVDWPGADLRDADLRECTFHMGSSRSGLVFTPIASEGTRTGFYTDEYHEQHFKSPEEIRKANLCRADLRGALIDGADFYLVDLRGAKYSDDQARNFERCGAILHNPQ